MIIFTIEIRYTVSQESCTTYIFSHYFPKVKVDSFDSLPIEKRSPLHNVTIVIKSVQKYSEILLDILRKMFLSISQKKSLNSSHSIMMLRFGERDKWQKKNFMLQKNL